MAFKSGPYTWYYGGVYLGIVEDAPRFRFDYSDEIITGDNLADAVQGQITRLGNLYVTMMFQEIDNAAVKDAFWPNDSDLGVVGNVGSLRALKVLNAIPQFTDNHPYTGFRADKTTLAPGHSIEHFLGSRLAQVPVTFLCMPYVDLSGANGDGKTKFFEVGEVAWSNGLVVSANQIVFDAVAGAYYITPGGGTTSGTGVGDDTGVTDWVLYTP